jgi:hypothetical protein
LTIISGCLGIGIGVAVVQGSSFLNWLLVDIWIGCVPVPLNTGCIASVIAVLATVFIVLGAVALIGGIFALRRRVWGFALAGAILSLPLIPFGTVLGILSIIFLSKSKNEFS